MTEEELEAEIQRLMANQTLADRELDRAIDKLYARFEREQEDDCEEEDELWERHFGRNSLAIVIFSPIFTLATKLVAPFFSFDSTALSFMIVALVFIVVACLVCAWLADTLRLSRFIFFQDRFYRPRQID